MLFFRTYSPQGDGNICRLVPADRNFELFFRTYSPQGDGNRVKELVDPAGYQILIQFFRTYSPQGDGNTAILVATWRTLSLLPGGFSEPIPRKGTETFGCAIKKTVLSMVFQNLFPARGRKRFPLRPWS